MQTTRVSHLQEETWITKCMSDCHMSLSILEDVQDVSTSSLQSAYFQ